VIYGAPNVGKSSLLNLLLGYERAIVSSRPGTTRDVIEETINLHGIPLRLVDTAGVRDSEDEIERAGMERTQRQVERADLVLHVADASEGISDFKFQDSDLKSRTVLVLEQD
jgi:tRNA modification GTPase